MADEIVTINVEGLKEFTKALKAVDKDLPKALRLAFNESADLVVDDAKPTVPRRSGRASKSVRKSSTRTKARVSGGSKRVPYYGWLDFGGKSGKDGAVYRQYRSDGRYIYAAYFPLRDSGRFAEVMQGELLDIARQAGLEMEKGE